MEPNSSHHNGVGMLGGVWLGDEKGIIVGRQGTTMMVVLEARSSEKCQGEESGVLFPSWKGWCQAPGCECPARTKGYCPRHYQQVRRYGRLTPEREYRHRETWCSAEGCHDLQVAKGYCYRHYQQIRRHGHLTPERERVYGRTGCQVRGCQNPHRARGYCQKHYASCYYESRKILGGNGQQVDSAMPAFADATQASGRGVPKPTSHVPAPPILYELDGGNRPCLPVPEGVARGGTA